MRSVIGRFGYFGWRRRRPKVREMSWSRSSLPSSTRRNTPIVRTSFEIEAIRTGSARRGPVFSASPAPSVSAAYLAVLGVSAALRARELTGLGQHVGTSLMQGAILYQSCGWQRPENPQAPGYMLPALDRRQGWGIVKTADRWVCTWTTPPDWAIAAAEGETLKRPDPEAVKARVMARKYGDQSFKAGEKENLADEMADVLWVLVCLANQTGVNLTEALEANFAKKTARDKERHRNNPKL